MPSSIKITNVSQGGSLVGTSKKMKIAFVGQSNGKLTLVSNKELTYDSTSQIIDSTADITSISKVSLYANNAFNNFTLGVDYQLSGSSVLWLNKTMSPPALEGVATFTGSADTTGDFVVTVLDQNGNESTPSSPLTLEWLNAGTSFKFYWTKVDFATGYKLYIKGNPNYKLLGSYDSTTTSATLTSATLTDVAGAGGYALTTNSTKRTPKLNDPYYIDYYAKTYDYTVQTMQSSDDVKQFYGVGSDLDNMGRFIFDELKLSEAYMVAANGTYDQAYNDAIDKLNIITDIPLLICTLKDSKVVNQYAFNHSVHYSQDEVQKERYAGLSVSNTINTVGLSTISNTCLYELASYDALKRGIFIVPNGNKVYANSWRETDGTISENILKGNQFFVGTVLGLMIAADDTASSIGGMSVPGWSFGPNGPLWNDDNEKNKFEAAGSIYVCSRNGVPVIYTDVTHDTSSIEVMERYIATAEDTMRDDVRSGLSNGKFLHKKLTKGKLRAAEQRIDNILSTEVTNGIIDGYRDIVCSQDAVVKTRVKIAYWYTCIYSIKEIFVEYSYDI